MESIQKKIQEFVECLDLIFLNPVHFASYYQEVGESFNWKYYTRIIAFFSALSLGVGSRLISPPYDSFSFISILFATIVNFVIFLFFPQFAGAIIDAMVQEKDRKGNAPMTQVLVSIALGIYVLYSPLAMIVLGLGLSGILAGYFILILLFIGLGLFVGRGIKYIHDFKNQDAFRLTFYALILSFVYPMVFNLYIAFAVLNMAM